MYFNGSVIYDGRATSTLSSGNYLLIHKNDKSVSIHAGSAIQPRNYMGTDSKLVLLDDTLIFTRKKEQLTIKIEELIYCQYMPEWSEDNIVISKTEHELVLKLLNNWPDYLDITCYSIEMEVETKYGKIDLLGTEFDGTEHIIEVKRTRAGVAAVTQLKRYVDASKMAFGYLAAPEIGKKAVMYLDECGYNYIKIDFD